MPQHCVSILAAWTAGSAHLDSSQANCHWNSPDYNSRHLRILHLAAPRARRVFQVAQGAVAERPALVCPQQSGPGPGPAPVNPALVTCPAQPQSHSWAGVEKSWLAVVQSLVLPAQGAAFPRLAAAQQTSKWTGETCQHVLVVADPPVWTALTRQSLNVMPRAAPDQPQGALHCWGAPHAAVGQCSGLLVSVLTSLVPAAGLGWVAEPVAEVAADGAAAGTWVAQTGLGCSRRVCPEPEVRWQQSQSW